MAATIGSLRAEMEAELAQFKSDMGKAAVAVEEFSNRAKAAGNKLDRYNRRIRDAESNTARFARQAQQATQRVGRFMTVGLTLPALAAGAAITRVAGNFESSMNRVGAISGATGADFEALRDRAREMGAATVFSASESADALGFLAMAGQSVSEQIEALPGVLDLAAAGQIDLARSADLATNILSIYRREVSQLGETNDLLVKTFTSSNTSLEELAEAFVYGGSLAAAAEVDIRDFLATLGVLADAGIKASSAGTQLSMAIAQMLSPSEDAKKAMRDLQLTWVDAEGDLLSLQDIIRQLEPHANDAGLFIELFGQRAGRAMAALAGQGADSIADLTDELQDVGGVAQAVAGRQMEGFNGKMRELRSAAEELALTIADAGLLDALTELATSITEVVRSLSETNPELLKTATIAIAVTAAVGPLLLAVSGLIRVGRGLAVVLPLVARGLVAFTATAAASTRTVAGLTSRLFLLWTAFEAGKRIGETEPMQKLAEEIGFAWARIRLSSEHGEEAVDAAIERVREQNRVAREGADGLEELAGANEEVEETLDGITESSRRTADELAAMVDEILRGDGTIESTTAELDSLRSTLQPVQAAVTEYTRNLALARQEGIAAADAQRVLARTAIDAAGGFDAILKSGAQIPAAIREIAAEMQRLEAEDAGKRLADGVDRIGESLDRVRMDSMAPLERSLARVDMQYGQLTDQIRDQIAENQRYADVSQVARANLLRLTVQLADVESAHLSARDAARSQVAALEAIEHAMSQLDASRIEAEIESLQTARGDFGVLTNAAREMVKIEQDLQDTRLRAVADLRTMEADLAEARRLGDDEHAARLERLVGLQRQYADVATETTAEQIVAQRRLADLVDNLQSSTQSAITDLLVGITSATEEFDFRRWARTFVDNIGRAIQENWSERITTAIFDRLGIGRNEQTVRRIYAGEIIDQGGGALGQQAGGAGGIFDQLLAPVRDVFGNMFGGGGGKGLGKSAKGAGAGGGMGGGMGSFFSSIGSSLQSFIGSFGGFFSEGGTLGPGKWAVAGEGGEAELIRAGSSPLDITPASQLGGARGDVIFNVTTPDPDGFRRSERQLAQMARRRFL